MYGPYGLYDFDRLPPPIPPPYDILTQELELFELEYWLRKAQERRRIAMERERAPPPTFPTEWGPVSCHLWLRYIYLGYIKSLFDLGMPITALGLMDVVTDGVRKGKM